VILRHYTKCAVAIAEALLAGAANVAAGLSGNIPAALIAKGAVTTAVVNATVECSEAIDQVRELERANRQFEMAHSIEIHNMDVNPHEWNKTS
jgi:hypothetical protein